MIPYAYSLSSALSFPFSFTLEYVQNLSSTFPLLLYMGLKSQPYGEHEKSLLIYNLFEVEYKNVSEQLVNLYLV